MKLLKSLICLTVVFQFAVAQFVSVQGVIRDNESNSIPDGEYTITFKLYSAESGGSASWTEEQTLTVTNGVYGAELGAVTSLTSLDWGTQFWLEIASITGASFSTNEALSPRTRMTMTPYAIMAGMSGTTNIIPQDGHVGIGTVSPSYKLHVVGDGQVGGSGEELKIGHVGHSGWAGIAHKNSAGSGGYAIMQRSDGMTLLNSASGQDLRFRINNSDKMTVKSNGYVGIGYNNPSYLLDINSGDSPIRIGPNASYSSSLLLGGWNTSTAEAQVRVSNGNLHIDAKNNHGIYLNYFHGGYTFLSPGGGRVMAGGTHSPSEALEVNGNIEFGGGSGGFKKFHATQDGWVRLFHGDGSGSYSHGFAAYNMWRVHEHHGSDIRLKENINDLDDGLDMVMQYRPVSYRLKSDEENKITYGFVAQEIQALVSSEKTMIADGPEGYLGLSYSQFVPVLTKAVQELKTEKDREIEVMQLEMENMANDLAEKDRAIEKIESELKRVIELLEN